MALNYLSAVDGFFPERPAGAARVAWDVAKMVRDLGHRVTLFCPRHTDAERERFEHEGVSVVRYDLPKSRGLDPFKLAKRCRTGILAAQRAMAGRQWDIVHSHSPLEGMIVHAALGEGPRYVSTVHSPAVLEQEINWAAQGFQGRIKLLLGKGQLRRIEGGVLKRAQAIQTLSRFTRHSIEATYDVASKVSVIPHWCRREFRRKHTKAMARKDLGWAERAKIIFTLRRLAPRMGLDVAIRAAAPLLLERSDLQFMIAGTGELEGSLKSLAVSLGVMDRVRFLGRLTDEQLMRCYEAADLFLLPTSALECFGLIILEALSFGLPVMATDAAAIPEVMRPVLPDFLVPAGREDVLRERLRRWLIGSLVSPSPEELCAYAASNYSEEVVHPLLRAFVGIEPISEGQQPSRRPLST